MGDGEGQRPVWATILLGLPRQANNLHSTMISTAFHVRLRALVWSLLLWGLCQGAAGQTAPLNTLVLCFENAEIHPWRLNNQQGLNFDLLRLSADKLKLRLEFRGLPWKRCLAEVQAHRMHGAFAVSFNPARRDVGAFPGGSSPDFNKRMHVDRYVLIKRKGSPVQWNGKSFVGLDGSVGVQLGYSIGDHLRGLGVEVDDGSPGPSALLDKLLAGRIQAAALGGSDAERLVSGGDGAAVQFEILSPPLIEKPYFLMLSHEFVRQNPQTAQRLWAAIEETRQSPSYQKTQAQRMAELSR